MKLLLILLLSFSFCADTKKAEEALLEYNNMKQLVTIILQKSDNAIRELTAIVIEQTKESEVPE